MSEFAKATSNLSTYNMILVLEGDIWNIEELMCRR